MKTIHINKNISASFGAPVAELFRILNLINQYKKEEIIIDFQRCHFLRPFLVLTLFTLQKKMVSDGYKIEFNVEGSMDVYGYLNLIYFLQNGFSPDDSRPEDNQQIMDTYALKTYIPVINFPARRIENQTEVRDQFIGVLGQILRHQIKAEGQMRSALIYLIDESINNIADHANDDRGYIFAQHYPSGGYMELCIVDTGATIKGSYQNIGRTDVSEDRVAIKMALDGISTKTEVTGRGFGIRTSRNMLVNGLGGKYLLISGSAAFLHIGVREEILTNSISWPGTAVYMRIPVAAGKDFSFYNYIEKG